MRTHVKPFLTDETGATAIEYGLIASLITIVCIASFVGLGAGNGGMWDNVRNKIGDALR